jgi:alpha-beta hydrolase superfamily lysophospholipase
VAENDLEDPQESNVRGDRGDHRRDLRDVAHHPGGDGAAPSHAVPRARRGPLTFTRVALGGLGLLIAGCTYLTHEKQGELIFRPTKEAWRGFNAGQYAFDEHWIDVGASQRLHAWWLPAEDPSAPAVLYLHGARWNLTGSVTRIDRWKRLGFAVLAVDYRGFGKSTDVAPTEALAYEDAEAAWDYLAKLAPGRQRFIVGHSLGGAIATELARRRPDAAGLVLEATFTSVRDMISQSKWGFLPVGLILNQEFNTLEKIPDVKVPVLVTHGTRDSIVPFEMGERLFEAVKAPKRFVKVEGAGHHNLSGVAFDEYSAALRELFKLRK